ncbi:MAG: hypothetical protein RLZZ297_1102 [Chloroflexota bacterium]
MQHTHLSEVTAFQCALAAAEAPVDFTTLAGLLGTPFLLVGSEEWLDRAVLQLAPRMPTTLPAGVCTFHALRYARLAALGWQVETTLVTSSAAAVENPELTTLWPSFCVLQPGTRAALWRGTPRVGDSSGYSAAEYGDALAAAPNGMFVTHGYMTGQGGPFEPREQIRFALGLLRAQTVFRFPTPQHPLRLAQAWHVGINSLEVIALAAETAAPLSIVADTVHAVFQTYRERAQLARTCLLQWIDAAETGRHGEQTSTAVSSLFDDIDYLYGILVAQYPDAKSRRALSIPEGELIAAACRDLKIVYSQLVEVVSTWDVQTAANVVGRPGFEPGTKSL